MCDGAACPLYNAGNIEPFGFSVSSYALPVSMRELSSAADVSLSCDLDLATRNRIFLHGVSQNIGGPLTISPVLAPRIDAPEEASFYISAKGPTARPRRTLKHNDTFAVVDNHGDIGASLGDPDGVFNNDTRYLSRLELTINGLQPLLLGSNVRDDNTILTVDLTNPDIFVRDKLVLQKDTIHIVRTSFIWNDVFYTRLGIRNHGDKRIDISIALTFGNDFADIFEARGMRRAQRGVQRPLVRGEQSAKLAYIGLDRITRTTSLHFEPEPDHFGDSIVSYNLALDPNARRSVFLTVSCNGGDQVQPPNFFRGMASASRSLRRSRREAISIGTSSDVFNQILARSLCDLRMLTTETVEGAYPYAGIPWYSTTFGRDGIITALEMLWCMPALARGVLSRLAAFQAKNDDPLNDAEPGKILHEMRNGEMARLREVPFGLYYGSVDATPLFVLLAGAYAERTGDYETVRSLWPKIDAALTWIGEHSALDGNGFLRHSRNTADGLANQGWKDSFDSIFHADGRLAEGSVALAEVQAYVFAAKRSIAKVARRLGLADQATRLEDEATTLAEHFEQAFWCEEIGTYAIALDGQGEPCRVRTSNAGHVLFGGLASPDRARRVAAGLMAPRFFSGWGIRTVAVGESRYNPMSYHNGSIWPHDNALIAMGLARYGFKSEASDVFEAISGAASYMDLRRLPELFCGFRRVKGQAPTLYPVACSPQAWASGAPISMLQACLGLEFEPEQNRIRLIDPMLPPFIDMVVLRNLELGKAMIDMALYRYGRNVSLQILRNDGGVEVSVSHRQPIGAG
jgi:glycogen debranching enzyme